MAVASAIDDLVAPNKARRPNSQLSPTEQAREPKCGARHSSIWYCSLGEQTRARGKRKRSDPNNEDQTPGPEDRAPKQQCTGPRPRRRHSTLTATVDKMDGLQGSDEWQTENETYGPVAVAI